MGHKVHPTGIRLGIAKDWNSKWYAGKKEYAEYLAADLKVREMLRKKLAAAGISKILIERPAKTARVTVHTARPGVVIGKRGEDIEKLRKEISDVMGVPAHINVTEVRKPELDAQLVAESIAQQLERRIMFRRAMKRAVGNAMRLGALGIKVNVAGRLNGAEIARSEWYREGRVPLHTLRADVDYGFAEAHTTYGVIGIKTWIYKGEIFDFSMVGQEKQDDSPRSERGDRGDRNDRADRPRGPRRERGDRGEARE
jgi:small subunit ribosomal protein S3